MKRNYGLPIVDSHNVFNVLERLGVEEWPRMADPIPLDEYRRSKLNEEQKAELDKYAPKAEVVNLVNPKTAEPFRGYRSVNRTWVTTFATIGDFVIITGEYKHGFEKVVLVPPSMVPGRELTGSNLKEAIIKSFEEETGITLKKVIELGSSLGSSTRQTTQSMLPYLGIPEAPIVPKKRKRMDLQPLLIPLKEWMKLLDAGKTNDLASPAVTLLALRKLGLLLPF